MLFEDDNYTYRIFCTSLSGSAHEVVGQYDKRADVENLMGEAKREGLEVIPSAKFKNNYAFFQLVMLSYNIWRYIKLLAAASQGIKEIPSLKTVASNTIRIARLKLLFIAAKVDFSCISYMASQYFTRKILKCLRSYFKMCYYGARI